MFGSVGCGGGGVLIWGVVVLRKGRDFVIESRALKSGGVRRYAWAECKECGARRAADIGIGCGRRGRCRRRYVGGMLHGRGGRGMRRQ